VRCLQTGTQTGERVRVRGEYFQQIGWKRGGILCFISRSMLKLLLTLRKTVDVKELNVVFEKYIA